VITGIGIDSIEIARIANACQRNPAFLRKMFTEAEQARAALKLRTPYEHLAACFAAREAFFKATQVWYKRQSVSVGQRASGEPYYILSEEIAAELGRRRVLLSLTHDRTHASAVCVCEEG
jgi:holo-[acyl-carrier protein] synthase